MRYLDTWESRHPNREVFLKPLLPKDLSLTR